MYNTVLAASFFCICLFGLYASDFVLFLFYICFFSLRPEVTWVCIHGLSWHQYDWKVN